MPDCWSAARPGWPRPERIGRHATFATLSGGYPAPFGLDPEAAVGAVVADQVEVGLAPVSDGGQRSADPIAAVMTQTGWAAAAYQATAALAPNVPVRQAIPGPYTIAGRVDGKGHRTRVALAAADRLRGEIAELAAAGCPLVWVDEPDAVRVGGDAGEQEFFAVLHHRLLEGIDGIHATLAISGGACEALGLATFGQTDYASFFFDLISGPDNWRVIARLPGDRGVICGAMDARTDAPADRELLVWAAHYAASTGGRGIDRVGLAPSGDMRGLDHAVARRKIEGLAAAAMLAAADQETMVAGLDPRVMGPSSRQAGRTGQRRQER